MGAVHIDTQRKAREYDAKYPLDTPDGCKAALTDYWRLKASGDYEAVDVLLELADTVRRAKLTTKQATALRLVYVEGYTQAEAADELGLSGKPGVNNLLQRGLRVMAGANGWGGMAKYEEWAQAMYGEGNE